MMLIFFMFINFFMSTLDIYTRFDTVEYSEKFAASALLGCKKTALQGQDLRKLHHRLRLIGTLDPI